MTRPSRPPLGLPPAKRPSLTWRRARKLYPCDSAALTFHCPVRAPGCTPYIMRGQAYLECEWGAGPFRFRSRHCEACARLFFADHLDTRLEPAVPSRANKKEPSHA